MFNYSKKTKIISSAIHIAIIIAIFIIVKIYNSQSKDLVLVSQVKILANSLEKYYDKFNAYPIVQKISGEDIKLISDQGLNQMGEVIYFAGNNFTWVRPIILISDGYNYRIDFSLDNSWPLWKLSGGGDCRLRTVRKMDCVSK